MRKILCLGLILLCACSAAYAEEEEIYWDRFPPADPVITEDDYSLDFRVPSTKSFGEQEIYDSFIPPEIEASPEEGNVPQAAAPIQPAPRPAVRQETTPRSLTIQRPADRRPAAPAQPPAARTAPKPAETSPGVESLLPSAESKTQIQDEKKRGTPVQATGGEADKPSGKKMRWGQVDTQKKADQPAPEQQSDQKSKFQWGRQ
ncbi:hypothetical protein [Desulfomonile tiedjei]|uniref:Uncharacterized protein n=1 Tax=Desulfomonile tiedjei (strain ATCC 49306 / DSM 6799 / DCB-1) TaxID=706587 RepID=I4BZW1_DESTA|nr:hypothetical protein [Desulfomonile tiedjei]AFM22852.1 hypothetical protein Desti_0103 [Desulfomonile tiedjei DSM 6799]